VELERDVEARLRVLVEAQGGLCLKFNPDYKRGAPDRLVLLPRGEVCWVETKRPAGGRLSTSQLVAHETLRRLGQQVAVVWTKEQAEYLVESLVRSGRRKEARRKKKSPEQ
jgi:hypothetical protein